MSGSSPPSRIRRKARNLKYYFDHTRYRTELFEDFEGRCAYSMQHHLHAGGAKHMEIDHHDPTLPPRTRNAYENLFLATRHCNGMKSDTWPSRSECAMGIRFLDPCTEVDYGEHIFEDPNTFELWGATPAGKYQIRVLGLNAEHLVYERRKRAELGKFLQNDSYYQFTGDLMSDSESANVAMKWSKEYVRLAIPPIPQKPKPPSI